MAEKERMEIISGLANGRPFNEVQKKLIAGSVIEVRDLNSGYVSAVQFSGSDLVFSEDAGPAELEVRHWMILCAILRGERQEGTKDGCQVIAKELAMTH